MKHPITAIAAVVALALTLAPAAMAAAPVEGSQGKAANAPTTPNGHTAEDNARAVNCGQGNPDRSNAAGKMNCEPQQSSKPSAQTGSTTGSGTSQAPATGTGTRTK